MIENYTRLSSRMFTATVVGKDKNGRNIKELPEPIKAKGQQGLWNWEA